MAVEGKADTLTDTETRMILEDAHRVLLNTTGTPAASISYRVSHPLFMATILKHAPCGTKK
jgi:hypothetical protein